MHSLVDYAWIGKTLIYTMYNAIEYTWIGKNKIEIYMNSQT